ncbi:hypothetical protein SKAU_G00285090 [Synaphobranchus kaupii]|uniref:G-protein coupled receptors family 1 profile domain-containing protein n=1 Tax=Synaphobranchus kaupii TaxID=118154 RepID=A0A9Q1IPD8_SYNKA|nr:hypothetical protein SKAU_G00285090 [Synaphobranchus kaupii]
MVPPGVNLTSESLPQDCPNCTQPSTPELNITKAVVLALVLGVFVIFGVLGNALVILSVACHRHLRTVTHYFIANLAVADLLLSLAVLPFSATFELLGRWVFGRPLCNAWAALDVLCCTASIMSLCAISVDRCIGVSYPLRYPAIVTQRRGLLALAAVWSLAGDHLCGPTLRLEGGSARRRHRLWHHRGARLCRFLRRGLLLRPSGRHLSHVLPGEGGEGVEALQGRAHFTLRLHKLSREKKAAKTLSIVVGCFILCWLPFFLVLPIGSIFPSYRPSDTVFKITFWLGYFNSCINPVIYPCFSQEFKKAFQDVLRVRCLSPKARVPPLSYPEGRGAHRLSTSVVAPSRTPSSLSPSRPHSPCRHWRVFLGPAPSGARVCSKSLLRACCWGEEEARPAPCPLVTDVSALHVVKVHRLSVCKGAAAV